jgi:hypothetical protein
MEVNELSYTVKYTSRRSEIWRWYWRAWARPAGFWRIHALFGISCGLVFTVIRNPNAFDPGFFLVASAVYTLGFVIFLPLWPQIRFKRAVRTLTIDSGGLTTSIGKISATRLWKELRAVDEREGAVVITGKNRNALIVPRRAFSSDLEQRQFYEAARGWHVEAMGYA